MKLTLRDILSWASFIGTTNDKVGLEPWLCYVHGASLVLLDGLGLGAGLSTTAVQAIQSRSYQFLMNQVPKEKIDALNGFEFGELLVHPPSVDDTGKAMSVGPFKIPLGPHMKTDLASSSLNYSLTAPTTGLNLSRVKAAKKRR